MNRCPSCSKPLEGSNPLKCPHCNIDIPTFIRINLEQLKKRQDFLEVYKGKIDEEVERKVRLRVLKHTRVLGLVCLACIAALYISDSMLIRGVITERLSRQLKDPEIQRQVAGAAVEHGKDLMRIELEPQIKRASEYAQRELTGFRSFVEDSKARLGAEYDTLAAQLTVLKSRNHMAQLANIAISQGKRQAFDELQRIAKGAQNNGLGEVASAEITRVKAFYATENPMNRQPVKYNSDDGIMIIDDKIPTSTLLSGLKANPDWRVRAKFAQLLGSRQDQQVAQELLGAAAIDQNLTVVKCALESFARITGFKSRDVFDYASAKDWWSRKQ